MNDGGPAFPIPHQAIDANDPFFKPGYKGMSLRDWFAAAAMTGIFASPKCFSNSDHPQQLNQQQVAEMAYVVADAMLAEREKSK